MAITTYKYRLKGNIKMLHTFARSVNFVWNYCNETINFAIKRDSKFLSDFDLNNLTSGSSKELKIQSSTIQEISRQYVSNRRTFKKIKLKWRSKRSLGWVPFKAGSVKITDNTVTYNKTSFKFIKSREIEGKIKTGSFVQDSRGRWYVNFVCEIENLEKSPDSSVGIDLGLKTMATLSNRVKFKANKYTKQYERKLALAQKDGKKKRARAIHAKIANCRRDDHHKISNEIAKLHDKVIVGDVSSSKLIKTRLAKSVSDAGWSQFKTFLKYKVIRRLGTYIEVSEHLTSRTCSSCGVVPPSSPKGLKGLGIREWVCSECGSVHDRDINDAINILRLGSQPLNLKGIRSYNE